MNYTYHSYYTSLKSKGFTRMPSLEARRTPLNPTDRANRAAKLPGSQGKKTAAHDNPLTKNTQIQNAESRNQAQHEYETDKDAPHADPELFHELVEEPDLVFADDIYALGVTHAGQPDTPHSVRKTARTATGNAIRQSHQGKRQLRNTDPNVHADPALFHELVEEPDLVFADDIYALGVTHAGTPDPPRLTRKSRTTTGNTRQANQAKRYIRVRRARPNADDLHWDDNLIHEVVEEPEYIFGEDIDALGVLHAGVPNGHPSGSKASRSVGNTAEPLRQPRRYVRVKRAVPASDDLHWDADVMHEVVEEPDYIFGDDLHALGVRHAGIPDPPRHARRRLRVKRIEPSASDLHWDADVMHEVVEEPDAVFGEDIDALGVTHAGVPDNPQSTKPTVRKVIRNVRGPVYGSKHRHRRQHADPRLFHELVEEPDAIFGDDIDALGVTHAGVPDDFAKKGVEISVSGVRLKLQATEKETLVTIKFPATMQLG
ncbi:hypothetical protein VE01_01137 [Pseudogymnoascus verrucosus]|uniref:Uncharacterized protein n=1 Tax=Pseudogymnoascus verrucosus TaxID=342668 RepID=A0A1B8GY86_9PEZI|nr:uncharacterized protein VE01_01137 [Pseudogymnoascus verrucosus]OBU00798.2 hypothetical protein VE01_01137 [Pseudogymnoascus verrucosus]